MNTGACAMSSDQTQAGHVPWGGVPVPYTTRARDWVFVPVNHLPIDLPRAALEAVSVNILPVCILFGKSKP